MRRWEYKKIALNEAPRRGDDIDLLCDAGNDGWELVSVLANGIAYLKRAINDCEPGAEDPAARREAPADAPEVKVKYREPVTGETWSGRGRMATWLKRKQEAGEDIDKYLV